MSGNGPPTVNLTMVVRWVRWCAPRPA